MKKLAKLFIIIGILSFFFGMYQAWLRFHTNRLAFTDYQPSVQATILTTEALPTKLVIKNRNIAVPIIPTEVKNNVWKTTKAGASYVLSSPLPGETGNSIMYAHNWTSLFGNLPLVKPDDRIEITYADGSQKTFEVQNTSTVSADESTILAPSKDKRITLYTCAGWFDEKRFVAVAILKG